MPECAWTNVETDVKSLVPAPMREEANGNDQPLDSVDRPCKLVQVGWSPLPDLNWGHPDVC